MRRFAAIVNPRGGNGQGLTVLEQVRSAFAEAGADLHAHVTEQPGHAGRVAGTLDPTAHDGLCVIGGDGTVHEVVGGLMQRGEPVSLPLGLIPAGTGNTLHHEVGCANPQEAVRRILAGNTRPLDAARVTTPDGVVWCVNIIGWGAVADINRTAEKLRFLGRHRYAVAALSHVARARRRRVKLILDNEVIEDDLLFVIACNTRTTGSRMLIAPRAAIDDGKLDVVVLRATSRVEMLKALAGVFDGSHLRLPSISYRQVSSMAIEHEGPEPLDLDGEIQGRAPFRVDMAPAALRLFA